MKRSSWLVVSLALLLFCGTQAVWAQVMDLGTYPGGTWADMYDINDFGLAVGAGDISSGYTRPIVIPLRGPNAMQWFDLGTFGGEETYNSWCNRVSNSGLAVGGAATEEGYAHAFAWTSKSGMVDLGTLEGDTESVAGGVNKSGTLIVGNSGPNPVAWTLDGSGTRWTIHKLDTEGFDEACCWPANANDAGQIVGMGWDATAEGDVAVALLWNPIPGKGEWKVMKLPTSAGYPHASASDINRAGEIAGMVLTPDWTALPAMWKPVAAKGSVWEVTVLPTLSGLPQGWNMPTELNDVGDIVGVSVIAGVSQMATRWSTKDPHFVQELGFPGDWSGAWAVNNNGIAVGNFGFGDPDQRPYRAVAVKFR